MAFRKTLTSRFLHMAKACTAQIRAAAPSRRAPPDPGEETSLLRRFLHKAPVPPDRGLALPVGDKLIERIRSLNPDRIRVDGLAPPARKAEEREIGRGISIEEARKVLRASQLEMVRSRLRAMERSCIGYKEFLKICCEISNSEQGLGLAKSLDDSGAVIVLGNVVFLRPDQVANAIENVIPLSLPHKDELEKKKELREMEEKKAIIDKQAESAVRRELWWGLGFVAVQTVGFLRLTFWELSWDVMEPICFYVTSVYFMAGYTFFLKTAREPSFEGYFQSRFATKQKRLMKAYDFDLSRFNELKRAHPGLVSPPSEQFANSSTCNCWRGVIGIVH